MPSRFSLHLKSILFAILLPMTSVLALLVLIWLKPDPPRWMVRFASGDWFPYFMAVLGLALLVCMEVMRREKLRDYLEREALANEIGKALDDAEAGEVSAHGDTTS